MHWLELVIDYSLWFGILSCFALLVLGVLWAPIGGIVVARLSRGSKTGTQISFGEAASASLLLFLPWLYLFLHSLGKTPSTAAVKGAYFIFFLLWLIGPVGVWLAASIQSAFLLEPENFAYEAQARIRLSFVAAVFLLINSFLVYRPLRRLLRSQPNVLVETSPTTQPIIPQEHLGVFRSAFLAFALLPVFLLPFALLTFALRRWE